MTTSPAPIPAWRWGVVWLLFLATLINYSDRLALASTQKYLLNEFVPPTSDTPLEVTKAAQNALLGQLNFAFGMAFALFQIAAGFLADRFSLRRVYLFAILLWSAAGLATGFVPAGLIWGLFACRILLGAGEAFNWPCAVACVRRVVPRESRGLANGIFHSGASVGAVLTPLLVLALVADDGTGWRTVFVVVGAVGGLWAVLWMWFTGGDRAVVVDAVAADADRPPLAGVFASRLFWICLAVAVGVNLCVHFYNQWFARYLEQELQFDKRQLQLTLVGFYLSADVGSMASGWTIRKLIRGGRSAERARKLVMTGLGLGVLAASVPAALLPATLIGVKLACFFAVAAAAVGGFAVCFSLVQDVSPAHTAQVVGVCGCGSWLVISLVTLAVGGYAGPGRYAELFVAIGFVPLMAAAVGWWWPEPKE